MADQDVTEYGKFHPDKTTGKRRDDRNLGVLIWNCMKICETEKAPKQRDGKLYESCKHAILSHIPSLTGMEK